MDAIARLTSKGQITIPKRVREALDLKQGDQVLLRVSDSRVVLAKTPDFLELAGSVPVPEEARGLSWDRIREEAWRDQTKRRR